MKHIFHYFSLFQILFFSVSFFSCALLYSAFLCISFTFSFSFCLFVCLFVCFFVCLSFFYFFFLLSLSFFFDFLFLSSTLKISCVVSLTKNYRPQGAKSTDRAILRKPKQAIVVLHGDSLLLL